MDNEKLTGQEMLVLNDSEGNLYVIPREAVEKYRAAGEKKSYLEATLGKDAVSSETGDHYAVHDSSAPYQLSRLVEAERDGRAHVRNAGSGHDENTASGIPMCTPEGKLRRQTFIGRFITLLTPQHNQLTPA